MKDFDSWLTEQEKEVGDVDYRDIERYVLELANRGYATGTVRGYYNGLSRLYGVLEKDEVVSSNPMEKVEWGDFDSLTDRSKREVESGEAIYYLNADDVSKLVKSVSSPVFRNRLIIKTLFYTGLRVNELCDIDISQLNRDKRRIENVYASKTDSTRTVFYPPDLERDFGKWLEGGYRDSNTSVHDSNKLFVSRHNGYLATSTIRGIVSEAAENAGLQETIYIDGKGAERHKITVHTLRHSFAVDSLDNGMDIRTLQKIMGHTSIETTQQYLQLLDDDLEKKYRERGPSPLS